MVPKLKASVAKEIAIENMDIAEWENIMAGIKETAKKGGTCYSMKGLLQPIIHSELISLGYEIYENNYFGVTKIWFNKPVLPNTHSTGPTT